MGNSVVIGRLWTIWKPVVDHAPFDVLGVAEMRFDPPAELREPHDLRIRQHRLVLQLRVDRMFLRPARRRGVDGEPLGADRLGDDLAVAHRVDVPVHQPGDQGLTEAKLASTETTLRSDVTGSAVNRMPAACAKTILLHDHGHLDRTVVDAPPLAVAHGSPPVNSEAQQRLTCWRIAAGPTTFRYVSCWPAKEAVGRSSAVALDRTA